MKKSTKRVIAALTASVMAMGMMAGCNNNNNGSASTSNSSTANSNSEPAADKVYNVGICQLVQHDALDAATKGFRDKLTELLGEKNVKFDEQNASGDAAQCATICNTFVSSGCDLIMANATPALQSATAATTSIPILGTSVTDYATALDMSDFQGTTGKNVSGTSDLAPLSEQANMIKELCPDAKTVGILYCSAEANSKYQATTITKNLTDLGYSVKKYTFSDSNDVAQVTTNACAESDVIYIPTDNTAASSAATIDPIASAAKTPIIAGEENICKACGVATLSISYYDLGVKTGEMAYDVLVNGKDVASMEIAYSPATTKEFVKSRAEALGIKIPDDYTEIAKAE